MKFWELAPQPDIFIYFFHMNKQSLNILDEWKQINTDNCESFLC